MPAINSIHFFVQTGNQSGAGTDGDVYLGLGGREFSVDTKSNDFERGAGLEYVLGDGATVKNAGVNDPKNPQLFTENVARFPVYVRFQPGSRGDNWQLQRAYVRFNGLLEIHWDTTPLVVNNPEEGIWLGVRSGLVAHLAKPGQEPL